MKRTVYVKYTKDALHLVEAVADTAEELARLTGVTKKRVLINCSPSREGLNDCWARVEFDDEDEFEDIILK